MADIKPNLIPLPNGDSVEVWPGQRLVMEFKYDALTYRVEDENGFQVNTITHSRPQPLYTFTPTVAASSGRPDDTMLNSTPAELAAYLRQCVASAGMFGPFYLRIAEVIEGLISDAETPTQDEIARVEAWLARGRPPCR